MFQTDQSTAVATLPAPAAAATPGYFTNGNPQTGVPATILDADFMNMLMMELINLVSAAGLTPSKSNYSQLLAAVKAVVVQANYNANSYFKSVGSGLIIEWGSVNSSASADVAVVFPLAFTSTPFVLATCQLSGAGAMAGFNTPTLTGVNINAWQSNTTRVVAPVNWLAIGH